MSDIFDVDDEPLGVANGSDWDSGSDSDAPAPRNRRKGRHKQAAAAPAAHFSCCCPLHLPPGLLRLRESLQGPLAALRKAARLVGSAAADAKLGVNVDEFVDRF
eukprot:gene8376-8560_t